MIKFGLCSEKLNFYYTPPTNQILSVHFVESEEGVPIE